MIVMRKVFLGGSWARDTHQLVSFWFSVGSFSVQGKTMKNGFCTIVMSNVSR